MWVWILGYLGEKKSVHTVGYYHLLLQPLTSLPIEFTANIWGTTWSRGGCGMRASVEIAVSLM